jgi:hypothetical protein
MRRADRVGDHADRPRGAARSRRDLAFRDVSGGRPIPADPLEPSAWRVVTEDELLTGLLELLALTGWRAYHVRRSDRAIVQGAGADGFPDVIAANGERARVIAFECKSDIGLPTPAQLEWLWALRTHPTIEATIVRPSTYDEAIRWIQGTGPMPDARVRDRR